MQVVERLHELGDRGGLTTADRSPAAGAGQGGVSRQMADASRVHDGFAKRERVEAAVDGRDVDRPPVGFWHHFDCGGSSGRLARATLDFFVRDFDLDIIKIMPDLPYPFARGSITAVPQWHLIEDWRGEETQFTASYVAAIRSVRAAVGAGYPIIVTIHAPLTLAQLFAADYGLVLEHLDAAPDVVHGALANLAVNLRRHAAACIAAGADGIYLSMVGCDATIPEATYLEIGRAYNLMVLQGASDGWLNIAHLHGDGPQRVSHTHSYPLAAVSWADRMTGPTLAEVRAETARCLMGGWHQRSPMLAEEGDAEQGAEAWLADARDAIAQTGGRGLILAPGCSVLATSARRSLMALRRTVDRL